MNIQFIPYKQKLYKRDQNGKYIKDANGKNIISGEKLCFYWWENRLVNDEIKPTKRTHMPPDWVKTERQLREYMKTFEIPDPSILSTGNNKSGNTMFKTYAESVITDMENEYSPSTISLYKTSVSHSFPS